MGVQMASSNKTASNLFMQNVEALAEGETPGPNKCTGPKHVITYQCRSSNEYECHDNSGC